MGEAASNEEEASSVSAAPDLRLRGQIDRAIADAGGWLPFDRFMALALYAPGLGYYARDSRQFGLMPSSGSDFVTAPELSPLFGTALAAQVAQALAGERQRHGVGVRRRLGRARAAAARRARRAVCAATASSSCRAACASASASGSRSLARGCAGSTRCPTRCEGVVVGNEVLDAMPVQLLHWDGRAWLERGVVATADGYAWRDRATPLAPPLAAARRDAQHFVPGYVTEIHPQAEAFIATLAERLTRGAAFFIDYGFPDAEYYHPQRSGGTLMCHRAHRADADPLADVGEKDITAHVELQRHRRRRAGRRPRGAGLHLAGALPAELRPRRAPAGRRPAHAHATREADRRARDGRAVQGDRLRPRLRVRRDRLHGRRPLACGLP